MRVTEHESFQMEHPNELLFAKYVIGSNHKNSMVFRANHPAGLVFKPLSTHFPTDSIRKIHHGYVLVYK